MQAIEPDMVLGKEAIDRKGVPLGRVVDVGLYTHSRVKFLVLSDDERHSRRVGVEDVDGFDADVVRVRVL